MVKKRLPPADRTLSDKIPNDFVFPHTGYYDKPEEENKCSCVTWKHLLLILFSALLVSGAIALYLHGTIPHEKYIRQTQILNENTGKYQPHYTEYVINGQYFLYGMFALMFGIIGTASIALEIWTERY